MAQTINNSASIVYNFNGGASETMLSNISSINLQTPSGLTLTKTANPTTFLPGEIITYTVEITNNSSSFLNGVRIIDNLGSGNLAYVLSSATLTAGTTTYPVNPISTNPLTFTLQQLASGATMTLTYKAQVIFNLPPSVLSITNSVQGIGYTATGTISGFANTTIEKKTENDFLVEKTSNVSDVMSNQPFNYIIRLANNTGSVVNITSITDNLPSNYNLTGATLRADSIDTITLLPTDYTIDSNNTMVVSSVSGQPIVISPNSVSLLTLTGYFD